VPSKKSAMTNKQKISLLRHAMIKIFLYGVCVLGIWLVIYMDAQWLIFNKDAKFSELSYTEFTQEILLLLTAAIFWITGTQTRPKRSFALLMSWVAAMALCREFDFLCNCVFDGCWKIPAALTTFGYGYIVFRYKDNFLNDAVEFIRRPESGILLSGLLTVFIFSRLFGCKILWEAMMGDGYMRCVKNAAEEGLELLGYLLILIAGVEYFFYKKALIKQTVG